MDRSPSVCVLLATHNGSKYLSSQLASLAAQTYRNLFVVATDDASIDDTRSILAQAVEEHGLVMERLLTNQGAPVGPLGAFNKLGLYAQGLEADYFAFCDQDDFWLPEKVEKQVSLIQALERRYPNIPLLVYSACAVTNQFGQAVATSFTQHAGIREPDPTEALKALVRFNYIPGNTMLFNQRLLRAAFPAPPDARMHDWWTALVAAAFGKVGRVSESLIDYRQHSENAVGARTKIEAVWKTIGDWSGVDREYCGAFRQAAALIEADGRRRAGMGSRDIALVRGFSELPTIDRISRVRWLLRNGLVHPSRLAKMLFWVRAVLIKCGHHEGL